MQIVVRADGTIRCIYSDELDELLGEGSVTTRRASHVEPLGRKWTADLTPVNGPILGPFDLRQQALDAEREWIEENVLIAP